MDGKPLVDWDWILRHLDDVGTRTFQHIQLTLIPVALGFVISLFLAIWAVRQPRVYGPLLAVSGLLYTIPSLAMFAFLRAIFGLSLITAIIPLTTYTLLILIRNNAEGFRAVPADVLEAAEAMGYTRRERLRRIELPLAVPLMIAGIRLALVTTIGLATVASILGDSFGGFGQFITEGLQTFFPTKIYLGAVLSIALAFTADFLLIRAEKRLTPWAQARGGTDLMPDVIGFLLDQVNWVGPTGIPTRLAEHLRICLLAVAAATAIGLPIGLYIGHTGRYANLAINLANIGRAVPSYALMVAVLPIALTMAPTIGYDPGLGLTFLPIFIAMMLLAIPPILVGAYAGLREVDRDLIEAGRGMGMREREILRRIELPIATPILIGGFRTATLQVIATATIGAILSYGGLGRFIIDGIARGEPAMLFAGAVLVTVLALLVDAVLAVVQRIVTPKALRGGGGMRPPEQLDETVVDPAMLGVPVRN